jgi:hypothetical protein
MAAASLGSLHESDNFGLLAFNGGIITRASFL